MRSRGLHALFLPTKSWLVTSENGPCRSTIHRPFPGDGTRPQIQVKRTVAGASFSFKFVESLLLLLEIRLRWSLINDEMKRPTEPESTRRLPWDNFTVATDFHYDGYHGMHLQHPPHGTDVAFMVVLTTL